MKKLFIFGFIYLSISCTPIESSPESERSAKRKHSNRDIHSQTGKQLEQNPSATPGQKVYPGDPCPSSQICGLGLNCNELTNTCSTICAKPSDCPIGSTCDPNRWICYSPSLMICAKACKTAGQCQLVTNECRAITREHCLQSAVCKEKGKCSVVNGECQRKTSEDCKLSKGCKENGACTYRYGACIANSASDCALFACKESGKCVYDKEAPKRIACLVKTDRHCKKSKLCKEQGLCTESNGSCITTDERSCAQSENCRKLGKCGLFEGVCVPTKDEHCTSSELCKKEGLCKADTGYNAYRHVCEAGNHEHCIQSTDCENYGKCEYSYSSDSCHNPD